MEKCHRLLITRTHLNVEATRRYHLSPHPLIVQLEDVFETDEHVHIVMEVRHSA